MTITFVPFNTCLAMNSLAVYDFPEPDDAKMHPFGLVKLKMSFMIGILFLFNPNQTPVLSTCKNWLVNGKNADKAEVVTLRLIDSSFVLNGRTDFKAWLMRNIGRVGTIIDEFNSDFTLLVNNCNSCLFFPWQLMYRLTLNNLSFPFCICSNTALVSWYCISKLGFMMPLDSWTNRSALCFCISLFKSTINVLNCLGSICMEISNCPFAVTILSKNPGSTILG